MEDSIDEWVNTLLAEKELAAKLAHGDIDRDDYSTNIEYNMFNMLKQHLGMERTQMTWSKDTVLVQGEEIDVKRGQIKHTDLKFFAKTQGFTRSLSPTKKIQNKAPLRAGSLKWTM